MSTTSTRWLRAAGLVGLGLCTRLVYLFALTDPGGVQSDAAHYNEIASNVAAGHGFASVFPQLDIHATAFRPPLYPVVLATLHRITGPSVVAGKLLNVAFGLVVMMLAYLVAARIRGPAAGFVAGALVAVYPPLIANDVNLLTEPLSLVLILLFVLVLGRDRLARSDLVAGGVVAGMLVLTRPSAQGLAVVAAVWLVARVGWRPALIFGAVAVIVVVPWAVRNETQVGTWSLVTSNGFNLAAMYSLPAQQTRSFVDPIQDPRMAQYRLGQFNEVQWDRDMTTVGLDGLRAHPTYLFANAGRNILATFEISPSMNDPAERLDGRNKPLRDWSLPLFYAVTGAGAWGGWRSRRQPGAQLLALVAATFVATSVVLVAPPRLRAPFDLACCIGTGALFADWRARSSRRCPDAQRAEKPRDETNTALVPL